MAYFVTLLRYIHQNPVKAGMVSEVKDYEFSSWGEYMIIRSRRERNSMMNGWAKLTNLSSQWVKMKRLKMRLNR